jgi:hypothetical protein
MVTGQISPREVAPRNCLRSRRHPTGFPGARWPIAESVAHPDRTQPSKTADRADPELVRDRSYLVVELHGEEWRLRRRVDFAD